MVIRVLLAFLGLALLLAGIGKIFWEFVSWMTLVKLGQRPSIYPDGSPRVWFWPFIILSAIGGTLLAIAMWI